MDVQISKLERKDIPTAAEVFYRSFNSVGEKWNLDYCVKRLEQCFNEKSCFKAEMTGKLVGVVTSKPDVIMDHEELYIDIIAVDPDMHKSGIGQKLLNTIEECAKNNGYLGVWLTASPGLPSFNWYIKSGYKEADWKVVYKEFN